MKVKLLRRLAQHKPGATVDYNDTIAAWLISHGHATNADHNPVDAKPTTAEPEQGNATPEAQAQGGDTQQPATYDPPPKAGRGSTTTAWRTYAANHNVTIPDDADRDDIITACRNAGIPVD